MTSTFLEEQAKARGITVSEMMAARSKLVKKRGLANNPEAAKRVSKLGVEAVKRKKLGSGAEG